jgi:hypothetical protein
MVRGTATVEVGDGAGWEPGEPRAMQPVVTTIKIVRATRKRRSLFCIFSTLENRLWREKKLPIRGRKPPGQRAARNGGVAHAAGEA